MKKSKNKSIYQKEWSPENITLHYKSFYWIITLINKVNDILQSTVTGNLPEVFVNIMSIYSELLRA